MMKTFFTLTTTDSLHTAVNARKFATFDEAVAEARKRLAGGFTKHGVPVEFKDVVIMKAFALVKPEYPPVSVSHPFED